MCDGEGYPEGRELRRIKKWDAIKDVHGLIEYIREMWRYTSYFSWDPGTEMLELHTAGWSGNEDIIDALKENAMFWALYWERSERGGHYYFIVREVI